jgi:hypothetical protein
MRDQDGEREKNAEFRYVLSRACLGKSSLFMHMNSTTHSNGNATACFVCFVFEIWVRIQDWSGLQDREQRGC